MPEVIANAVPDYTQFGRATKLRLNPNKVEDLQWTIPGEFTTPETQVSEVSDSTVQENPSISQDTETQTTTGKSDRTIQLGTSWFWSITEKFKEGLHRQVTSINNSSPLHSDQPILIGTQFGG